MGNPTNFQTATQQCRDVLMNQLGPIGGAQNARGANAVNENALLAKKAVDLFVASARSVFPELDYSIKHDHRWPGPILVVDFYMRQTAPELRYTMSFWIDTPIVEVEAVCRGMLHNLVDMIVRKGGSITRRWIVRPELSKVPGINAMRNNPWDIEEFMPPPMSSLGSAVMTTHSYSWGYRW